jgi:NTP pyrophosphatase (non-canonical NTP hydrolase)
MNRTALIEAMARAISDAQGFPADECFNIGHQKFPNETMANWENYTDEAAAALSALEAMAAIVPRKATDDNWTLADLRRCNRDRQAAWCPDQKPDLSFRGNELGGECGEAQNIIKKLERERHGWRGSRASLDELAAELADVVICADLAAMTAGVDLMDAVKSKFDATSARVGLPQRLTASPYAKETTDE